MRSVLSQQTCEVSTVTRSGSFCLIYWENEDRSQQPDGCHSRKHRLHRGGCAGVAEGPKGTLQRHCNHIHVELSPLVRREAPGWQTVGKQEGTGQGLQELSCCAVGNVTRAIPWLPLQEDLCALTSPSALPFGRMGLLLKYEISWVRNKPLVFE